MKYKPGWPERCSTACRKVASWRDATIVIGFNQMAKRITEIEGTWEEVAANAAQFAGRRVRLIVLEEGKPSAYQSPSVEEVLADIWADVSKDEWAKLPSDLSANLDYYLYGTPKRR